MWHSIASKIHTQFQLFTEAHDILFSSDTVTGYYNYFAYLMAIHSTRVATRVATRVEVHCACVRDVCVLVGIISVLRFGSRRSEAPC